MNNGKTNPTSNLGIIRTYPCVDEFNITDRRLKITTVPFYGQGMNCGFEDCRILDELLDKNNEDINKCIKIFSEIRKPNGNGLQDLSMLQLYCNER